MAKQKWPRDAEVEAALLDYRDHIVSWHGKGFTEDASALAAVFRNNLEVDEIPRWRNTFLARAFEDGDSTCAMGLAFSKDRISADVLLDGMRSGTLPDESALWTLFAYWILHYKPAGEAGLHLLQRSSLHFHHDWIRSMTDELLGRKKAE